MLRSLKSNLFQKVVNLDRLKLPTLSCGEQQMNSPYSSFTSPSYCYFSRPPEAFPRTCIAVIQGFRQIFYMFVILPLCSSLLSSIILLTFCSACPRLCLIPQISNMVAVYCYSCIGKSLQTFKSHSWKFFFQGQIFFYF